MKKQLLASTMLVAAGVLTATGAAEAGAVKLGLGGYMEQIVGVTFSRPPAILGGTVSSFDQQSESEIFFRGSGKLDNGIEIRAQVELEVAGSPGNPIDEQYMIVRGNFGQVILGSEDNAGHLMTIGYMGSWATGVGQNLTFDTTDWIPLANGLTGGGARFNGTLNDPRLRSGDNDSSKVSYFSPRFAGIQVGGSYIPNFRQQTFGAAGAGGDPGGLPNKDLGTSDGYNEGWAAGVNFDRKFDQMGLGVAFGFLTAAPPSGPLNERMKAYAAALRVDFGPIRVAGGVKVNEDLFSDAGGTNSLEGMIWDIGARYTAGPNAFSVGFRSGRMEASVANPAKDKEHALMVAYRRTLGPGVFWTANVLYADTKSEDHALGLARSSYDNVAATTTIKLIF